MRASLFLVPLLLAVPLAALVPSASADATCWGGEADCPHGVLVCTYKPQVCVPDPCDDAQCWVWEPTTSSAVAICAVVVDEPDFGYRVCYDPHTFQCVVYDEVTTKRGTETRCYVGFA